MPKRQRVSETSKKPIDVSDDQSYNPSSGVQKSLEETAPASTQRRLIWRRVRRKRGHLVVSPGRPPLAKEERDRILKALKRDPNFSSVARETGASISTVARVAAANNIRPKSHRGTRVSEEKRREVIEALERTPNYRAVAAEVGDITHKTVSKIAKEEGLESAFGARIIANPKRSNIKRSSTSSRHLTA
jgi:uncharacterized protein YerC